MPTTTLQPTSNTTPDPAQGGTAVTSASNTGHGSTNVTHANQVGSTTKSCLWTGFAAGSSAPDAVTLSFSYSENGTVSGDGANSFRVQYSIDGGSNWTNVISHTNVTSSTSTSAQVSLSNSQNLTLVQVRSRLQCSGNGVGNGATIDASVSSIQITVIAGEQNRAIVIM